MPRGYPQSNVQGIAQEIERYLSSRSLAADNLEGITVWWLSRQRYEESKLLVHQALELLVQRGVLVKSLGPTGDILYFKPESVDLPRDPEGKRRS